MKAYKSFADIPTPKGRNIGCSGLLYTDFEMNEVINNDHSFWDKVNYNSLAQDLNSIKSNRIIICYGCGAIIRNTTCEYCGGR